MAHAGKVVAGTTPACSCFYCGRVHLQHPTAKNSDSVINDTVHPGNSALAAASAASLFDAKKLFFEHGSKLEGGTNLKK